ncbi:adenosylmethionine--8-amino-7-oxononanoate transaminase [Asticcacaulis sp. EMRT-3]|uniref:adenosylmethionine--8-amino-7-oxononanoate transaminase n=1 Tax=Asticcacaulis sp. EMRT-3 TaxID=3040349 RepID=UPI0024AEACEB|nr:adenosylmethionine--8-amino-7-oxononanoate transaminase [Asticcacaulis sp. EMRT-3]MDI7776642.1 adenosylmethionine--8-amino-7-oxononanoate transaminase [Asticcacaulis sp. EMRT-3]
MTSPLWHPFTQHALMPEQVFIDRAEGAYLYDRSGKRIIDAISSWWVNIHGHNHPKIVSAVQAQAAQLDQIIFAGFTHAPAEELAARLVALTGPELTRVFFSDSGSTAVEVALKMALGYWTHKGKARGGIVTLDHAYHGDTFGGMSVGGRSVFNAAYEPMLFDVHRLPCPMPGAEHLTVEAFERLLQTQGDDMAALILEPLVLGAAGMLMYSPTTLRALYDLCQRYGVLFIADEVMTGWGRTGTRFACDQAGITPDIVCLSKGLTGGYLPLAVTMASEEIYQAFYSPDRAKTFFHSSSFTGNPLACAAANASLALWDEEPVMARIQTLHRQQAALIPHLAARPDVTNIRHTGTILAFDLRVDDPGYLSGIGPKLYRYFINHGILLRPLGETLYMLPPYCVTKDDLDVIVATLDGALDALAHGELE